MNEFLIVMFVVITLIITMLIIYVHLYNKLSESIIRIDEAEARIDNNLRDKYDLLNRSIALMRSKVELDSDAFKDIIKLRSRKISNFDLDRVLVKSYDEFLNIYTGKPEVKENNELYKVAKQLEVINDELSTLRNYYNGNITNYNIMIKKFPTNVVAKIMKYKERPFYDLKDMKDDDHNDFKL